MKLVLFALSLLVTAFALHVHADAAAPATTANLATAAAAAPAPAATVTAAPTAAAPSGLIAWLAKYYGLILGVLFGISEALSLIPGVQSNGVFQLIFNLLKSLKSQLPSSTTPPAST